MSATIPCVECGVPWTADEGQDPMFPCPACQEKASILDAEVINELPEEDIFPSAHDDPRYPCPFCQERIVVGAAKCRFCGAIFDESLKPEPFDPKTVVTFRKNIHGLGGIWIVFGIIVLFLAIIGASDFDRSPLPREEKAAIMTFFLFLSIGWFTVGFATLAKKLWGVYVGLTMQYISALGTLATLQIIPVIVSIVIILQGHRTLKLARQLTKAKVPLTANPRDFASQQA